MKLMRMLFVISAVMLALSSAAVAADFDWVKDFNIRAEANPSGFRAQLAARFKIKGMDELYIQELHSSLNAFCRHQCPSSKAHFDVSRTWE